MFWTLPKVQGRQKELSNSILLRTFKLSLQALENVPPSARRFWCSSSEVTVTASLILKAFLFLSTLHPRRNFLVLVVWWLFGALLIGNLHLVWSGQHKQSHSLCTELHSSYTMKVVSSVVTESLGEGRYWRMFQIGFIECLRPTSFKILLIFSVVPWMYRSDINLVNVGNSRCDLGFGG